jgi:hypothetical protein
MPSSSRSYHLLACGKKEPSDKGNKEGKATYEERGHWTCPDVEGGDV